MTRRFLTRLAIIASVLAIPTAAYAATHLAKSSCSCGSDCPCGDDCPCNH
jgi:hypothetical protein